MLSLFLYHIIQYWHIFVYYLVCRCNYSIFFYITLGVWGWGHLVINQKALQCSVVSEHGQGYKFLTVFMRQTTLLIGLVKVFIVSLCLAYCCNARVRQDDRNAFVRLPLHIVRSGSYEHPRSPWSDAKSSCPSSCLSFFPLSHLSINRSRRSKSGVTCHPVPVLGVCPPCCCVS